MLQEIERQREVGRLEGGLRTTNVGDSTLAVRLCASIVSNIWCCVTMSSYFDNLFSCLMLCKVMIRYLLVM